ncbi:MAG: hypothetical protein EBT86_00450 [Actinobacteria bacterium]|nr:hypothetical protein [Actinomycetota bacterium]
MDHVSESNPSNLSIKFIKGIPFFVDAENNVYLFIRSTSQANYPKVIIGKIDGGETITMLPDWQRNSEVIQSINFYRETLSPIERTEHTKAVKISRKKTKGASATLTVTTTATAVANAVLVSGDNSTAPIERRPKSRIKKQTGTGPNSRELSKSAKSP